MVVFFVCAKIKEKKKRTRVCTKVDGKGGANHSHYTAQFAQQQRKTTTADAAAAASVVASSSRGNKTVDSLSCDTKTTL